MCFGGGGTHSLWEMKDTLTDFSPESSFDLVIMAALHFQP